MDYLSSYCELNFLGHQVTGTTWSTYASRVYGRASGGDQTSTSIKTNISLANKISLKFGARRDTIPRTGSSISENNGEVSRVLLILDMSFLTSPYPGPKVVTQPTSNLLSVTRFL